MELLNYWYIVTIIIFTGTANYLLWTKRAHLLRKHWKFIFGYAIFTVPWAYWDAVALRWHAYQYSPAHTLSIRIYGAEFETYVFMVLVGVTVCAATLIYLEQEEKGKLRFRYHTRTIKKKPKGSRKLIPATSTGRR